MCNIGLKAVSQSNSPTLNLHRLAWVKQNYFRPETLEKANIHLVNYHTGLELAHKWGGGEVASADGLRFVVPVRSIYTGYNSKYFGSDKGLTLYHFVSDQFSSVRYGGKTLERRPALFWKVNGSMSNLNLHAARGDSERFGTLGANPSSLWAQPRVKTKRFHSSLESSKTRVPWIEHIVRAFVRGVNG